MQVVKAQHVESARVVALKRIWAASHGASGASDPVQREIETMSAVSHDNVVRLTRTIPLVRLIPVYAACTMPHLYDCGPMASMRKVWFVFEPACRTFLNVAALQ